MSKNVAYLVASGDSRLSANQEGWKAQEVLESALINAFKEKNWVLKRAHPFNTDLQHGFIFTQRMGLNVFSSIPTTAPVVAAVGVWQYSYFLVPGMIKHRGPILTVGNWSGQFPGLVGLLNLNASLCRVGRDYSTIWSEFFTDEFFKTKLDDWLSYFSITQDHSHVTNFEILSDKILNNSSFGDSISIGREVASNILYHSVIIGIFDEGCMGMINALFPDELLARIGFFKERLSQSTLLAEMNRVSLKEAKRVYNWLLGKGMQFHFGPNPEKDLTEDQVLSQCKMYIAAVRIAHSFSCDAIGIQYQQGLKDMCPASDLAEALLNNVERPPVYDEKDNELFSGLAIPHFNEVDQGAAVDCLITNRIWLAHELDPATTLHDVRYGEYYKGKFVWVFEISGAVPASHFANSWKDAIGERQPPMYFPLGGSTCKGVSKPGVIIWSRVYIEMGILHVDMGIADVIELPLDEVNRRWKLTTSQWPIMSVVFRGVTRDQFMGRHKSNHIQVAYVPAEKANNLLISKAISFHELGVKVSFCGDDVLS